MINPTKNFATIFKKHSSTIILLVLTFIFFSFSVILTYDSGHYLGYVSIFEGKTEASNWDIVRGPVFPLIIQLSNILFGKTSTGILVCIFIFYLSFALICHIICKELFSKTKHKKLFRRLLLIFLILNPLILGYYHVLLTEFVSITIAMLNILLAYKWIYIDRKNKKISILYSLYFVLSAIICWHLKQPYIIIAITPPIIAAIISLIANHKKNNIIYRIGTIALSGVILIVSIFVWNNILSMMNVDKTSDRDSSSMLGKQLLTTYQIPYESTKNNQGVSTSEAISILASNFFNNPGNIIGTYLKNYCGLTSICEVTSENGVDYIATSKIVPIQTYENTLIGYATYQKEDNIFYMTNEMRDRAAPYSTPTSHSIFTIPMKILMYPTNLLFKLSTLLCLPTFILLIIFKIKTKNKRYNQLFCLNLILLGTASFHLLLSAAAALVIDRYAIEAFTPSVMGICGTISYITLTIRANKSHKLQK